MRVVVAGTGALCRVSTSGDCVVKSRCARFLIYCSSWVSRAEAIRFMVPARCTPWTGRIAAVFRSTSRRRVFTATNVGNTVINSSSGQPRRNSRSTTQHLTFASGYRENRPGSIVGELPHPRSHKRLTEKRPPVLCPGEKSLLKSQPKRTDSPPWLRPTAALGRSVAHRWIVSGSSRNATKGVPYRSSKGNETLELEAALDLE